VEADHPEGPLEVRHVQPYQAVKPYRCPGCDHEIRPATPHVVAWPAAWGADGDRDEDAGLGERRHWHTACWRARDRRR
jgi:hypothetical protein